MNRFLTNFLSKTLLLGMSFDRAVILSSAAAVFSEVGDVVRSASKLAGSPVFSIAQAVSRRGLRVELLRNLVGSLKITAPIFPRKHS